MESSCKHGIETSNSIKVLSGCTAGGFSSRVQLCGVNLLVPYNSDISTDFIVYTDSHTLQLLS
jgi:hypothetical protein